MKSKEIVKLLFPGVIVGMILGFGLGMLVGVNESDPIPNYIGGILCCIIPTILNCTVVLKMGSKGLGRSISFGKVLKRIIPYIILSAVVGLFTYTVIIEQIAGVNSCDLSKVLNAIIQACLGIVTSTFAGYFAITTYVRDVKYTRKSKKK